MGYDCEDSALEPKWGTILIIPPKEKIEYLEAANKMSL